MFAKSLAILASAALAAAELHIVWFDNRCGNGEPVIVQNGEQLSSGDYSYIFRGPATAASAFLQDGSCGAAGENCTLVEFTLVDGVNSADISLIEPHTFSQSVGFAYSNGCDGEGKTCASADCPEAFHDADDFDAEVQCARNDVNLNITFC